MSLPDLLRLDMHGAARRLRRMPAFFIVAVLTVAAGVASNVAVFGVLRAVVLDPLPFRAPEELVMLHVHAAGDRGTLFEVSHPDFRDLRDASGTFAAMGAWPSAEGPRVWEVDGVVETTKVVRVSGAYFEALGTAPLLGRTIEPGDDVAGAAPVVVLSWGAWQNRLGGAGDVLGRVIRLDGDPYTVVGVMPRAFADPAGGAGWTALVPEVGAFAEDRGVGFLRVLGRVRAGITPDAAAAEATRIMQDLAAQHGPSGREPAATAESLSSALFGSARTALLLLSAAAALVLLLACANVANLLLARGITRRGELAMRVALGASRGRLIADVVSESLVIGLVGGVLGAWAVALGMDALANVLPSDLYRVDAVRVDARIIAFALVLSLIAASAFGAAAALLSTRTRGLTRSLASTRTTSGTELRRAGRALMAAQVGLATVVLVGGGLIGRSFLALRSADPGYDTERVLSFELFLPDADGPQAVAAVHERLLERLRALPGVDDAASVLLRPLEGPEGYDYPFTLEDLPPADQASNPFLNYEAVTPTYFRTLDIPLVAGRAFTPADGADAPPVVILSQTTARRMFGDADAIGRRLRWGTNGGFGPWLTVIGVVGETRYRGLSAASLDVYVPYGQTPWALRHVMVRTSAPPAAMRAAIEAEVSAVQPGAHAIRMATLEQLADETLARPRFHAVLFGLFGGAALLLAAIGTYGVIAHFVSRRARELGVRTALGARPAELGGLVIGDALRTAAFGLIAGLAAAALLARSLSSMLWSVPPLDPLTFTSVAALVAAITLLAASIPARRAARTDPATVLRQE